MNILEACDSPHVFRRWFKDRATWQAWFAFLAALFALPMTSEQYLLYRRHTGRDDAPFAPHKIAWLICGRKAGKSFVMALTAVFLACLREYRQYLQPGERATVAVIAADRKQARIIMRFARAMLTEIPAFKKMLEAERSDSFDLNNQVTIEIGTASATSTRGYVYAAVLNDEIAHWPMGDRAAETDREILEAIRPGMITIPGAVMLCASSPYARKGEMWEAYRQYYGKDGPLVWQADTRAMNPTASQAEIDEAYAKDPAWAAAEFGACFRQDIEGYVSLDVVEACVAPGVRERAYDPGLARQYRAFFDGSGGRSDSAVLAIGHREDRRAVIDVVIERKAPHSPAAVIEQFAYHLTVFGIREVHSDRYAGQYPIDEFSKYQITCRPADKVKSDLYRDFLPLLNSGRVDLIDSPVLVNQLVGLERRVARGGKDSIDHAPNGHDDVANAVAGVASLLSFGSTYTLDNLGGLRALVDGLGGGYERCF